MFGRRWLGMGVAMLVTILPTGCYMGEQPSRPAPLRGDRVDRTGDPASAADQLAEKATREFLAGDRDAASKDINLALQMRIDRSYYHLLNALIYHVRGKEGDRAAFDLAEQGYDQAIHFDPSNWMAYYYRGRLRVDLADYTHALSDFAEALMYRPDDTQAQEAFSYAAYRSGHPDLAAGVLTQLEESGRPVPASVWRNAAMTMAALGRLEKADQYAGRFEQSGSSPQDVAHLRRRIADWASLHNSGMLQMAAFDTTTITQTGPTYVPTGGGHYGADDYAGQPGTVPDAPKSDPATVIESGKTARGTEDKMVVIDVILISTEETITTNRGVNLMNGLTLQFGGTVDGNALPALGYASVSSAGVKSTSITRAITLPSVTYTLNILDANNQRNEVLSRPTLIGLAGKQSDFFSGVELNAAAVAGGGTTTGGGISIGGGQAINIQKEIGIKLSVMPTILEDGRLKLAINAERTFLQTPSSTVNFTFKIETSKDQINANVVMRYGETLILGGLSEKETELTRDGVPGLQDTPLLQYLFSNEATSDYQKSTIILLTPRPPQYVYQPEDARKEYMRSLSEDERPVATLQSRYSDWFAPYPNWASVFHHLQENGLYREFRTGDVDLESWSDMRSLQDRLNQALDFLHY